MGYKTARAFVRAIVLSSVAMAAVPALAQGKPKYAADVPAWITTPDSVETRLGTLKFHNGAPDDATVKLVYDKLDFSRGVDAFLTGFRRPPSGRSATASNRSA